MKDAIAYLKSIGAKLERSSVPGHLVVDGAVLSMDEIRRLATPGASLGTSAH